MTMLDRMRRHRNWLKWSLALVCLAFVMFYIPDFLRGASGTDAGGVRHRRRGRTATRFAATSSGAAYQAQLQAYRAAYGGQMSEQLLKQLGIDQQILQQLVDERAALAEAERVGVKVSDEEVRAADLRDPGLPGERRVHRRAALPAAPRVAAPAADHRRVRRERPPRARRSRSCARR